MVRRTRTLTIFAALFALILAFWAPAALAHHKDGHDSGNDRKSGYEDNSSEPQETNHGQDADNDGDADSDSNTAYDEDTDSDGVDNDEDTTASSHPSGNDKTIEQGGSGNQGRSESNPDDSKGPMRYEGTQGDDKPNGPGGSDIYDQDGNNGCGNDQDFDDDNNGWCGKPDRVKGSKTPPPPPCDADATMPGVQRCDTVGGEVIEKPCEADATMPGVQKCEKPDEVEGDVIVDKPCPLSPIMGDVLGDLCDKDEDEVEGADLDKQPSAPEDNVLGVRVSAAPAVAPAAVAPAVVEAAPEAAGAVLPFTGAADLLPFVAVALMLIGIGALSLRARRNSA